jgi:hypothetical protein
MSRSLGFLLLLALPVNAWAQVPADIATPDQLAAILKPILIEKMPPVLYDKTDNWGHQAMVPVGLRWRGLKAEVMKSPRNHGEWRKMKVTGRDLPRTLELKISEVRNIDSEKQRFKVFLTFLMGVHYEQQNWANGARLWSGSVRARAQVKLDLECENTIKVVFDNVLPDFILRMRVINAKVSYDHLVTEHINGIGGTGAKVVGDALHDTIKLWRPSLERDLLARAGEAVVRSGDTRDIRIGFGSLFKAKKAP